jgi:hypothetical protein
MTHDSRRITLISSGPSRREWLQSPLTPSRVITADSLNVLRHALAGGVEELHADVERVVLDRCGSASDYLTVLATLPVEFAGDVVMVCSDGKAFLSATGRGGDRVLYVLTESDLDFYFEAHQLVKGTHSEAALQAALANPASVWMRAAA